MLQLRNAVAGLCLLAVPILGGGPAMAAPVAHGYVTTALNLRAGPDTEYPVVATMQAGDQVTIYGCLSGWTWCDIDWRGYRGWANSDYLQVVYHQYRRPIVRYGRYFDLPFLSFSIGPYWDQHYRHRRFFNEMGRFERRHGRRPPSRVYRYQGHPRRHVYQPTAPAPQLVQPQATPPHKGKRTRHPPMRLHRHTVAPYAVRRHMGKPTHAGTYGKRSTPHLKQRGGYPHKMTQHGRRLRYKPGQRLVNGVCR